MASRNNSIRLLITGAEVGIEMEMPGPASFLQVKQKIKEIANVEEDRQTLFYNQVRLEDEYLVYEFVYDEFAELELRVAPLPGDPKVAIVAKSPNREDEPINVRETQSVAHLRNKISRRWGIPPKKITLTRLSHDMEDAHRLSDYYVCEGAEVNVAVHISPR